MSELHDVLRKLAELRRDTGAAAEAVVRAKAVRDATPEGQIVADLEDKWAVLVEQMKAADAQVRALAMTAFRETGDKAPAAGVTIKLFRRTVYDEATALAWCKAWAPVLVVEQLDTAGFEKMAESLIACGAPVEIVQEPWPQIARELTAYLRQAEAATDDAQIVGH